MLFCIDCDDWSYIFVQKFRAVKDAYETLQTCTRSAQSRVVRHKPTLIFIDRSISFWPFCWTKYFEFFFIWAINLYFCCVRCRVMSMLKMAVVEACAVQNQTTKRKQERINVWTLFKHIFWKMNFTKVVHHLTFCNFCKAWCIGFCLLAVALVLRVFF